MLFAQVVNSLILKVKDIAIFAVKISNFSKEAGYIFKSQNHVNWHRESKRLEGGGGEGKETGNLEINLSGDPARLYEGYVLSIFY